jgi:RimJ/RimL family protein N-acetyltransferase
VIHPVPRLTTDRLLLREWQASDREPFAAINADGIVIRSKGERKEQARRGSVDHRPGI